MGRLWLRLLIFFHSQIVVYRKYARDALGLHLRNLLVHLARDYTFEGHVTIVDDDVNRRNSAHAVGGQSAVP